MIDPITALTIFGAIFSTISGVEKIYSVVVEGEPIINTNRYHSQVPTQKMNRVYTVHNKKYDCIQYQGKKYCQ